MMMDRVVYPGQHVISAAGDVVVVAYVRPDGTVMAWRGRAPWPVPVIVRGDAWGGEHDQHVGLLAA